VHSRRAGWKQPSVIAGVHSHPYRDKSVTYALVGNETGGYTLTPTVTDDCRGTCFNCPDGLVSEIGDVCCDGGDTYELDDTGDVPVNP
jgi:hypothetical protein